MRIGILLCVLLSLGVSSAEESPTVAAAVDGGPVGGAKALAAGDTAAPVVLFDEGALPAELVELALSVRDRPLGERMAAISQPLLGRPYLEDAAGEGERPDPDPPARYDTFDCLTFVEEILSLALPADPRSAPSVRQGLRYGAGGPVRYDNRNHFMLEQWIPNAIDQGWLIDITSQLGETWLMDKTVDAGTWKRWRKRSRFALLDHQLPQGDYRMPVLSPGAATEAVDRIPDGALILTVRQSRDDVPIVVTHLGFRIPSPDVPLMRHATRMGAEPRVRDERLVWYLEHVRWYERWPVVGVNVLMPQEAGPRVARVVAAEEAAEQARQAALVLERQGLSGG